MTKKEKAAVAVKALAELYPEGICSLDHGGDPFRLLIMAILSAQCTDARVNAVSVELFRTYPTAAEMATAPIEDLERLIHSVGLYHSKAKNIKATAERLTEAYGGAIPKEMKDLLTLPGVGRKVANLIRGDLFGLGGIVADTHCIRISARLGLTEGKSPIEVEKKLDKLIPKESQSDFCHRLVLFGREYCSAKKPRCGDCPFAALGIGCKP